jgi:hypothetical protein
MSKFDNKNKSNFLEKLSSLASLADEDNDLTSRSKFNFSYFTSDQEAGQKFHEWSHKQLYELLGKIKEYSAQPLEYWQQQRVGAGGLKVLAIYGGFPHKSSFTHPSHVPHQALWGRFRLGSKLRLIGFVVPNECHKTLHKNTNEFFDKNTFYVVFLDQNHKFYLSEKA